MRAIITILFLLGICKIGSAQSDNYWSWNFNTPSTLLAGSVVGGTAGPSAIYYNPSLIDHENIPSLSLSANIISLQFFNASNIAGDDINAKEFFFKVQPRFISYVLPTKKKKLGVEIAILSPVSEDVSFNIQHFDTLNIIERTNGDERYSGILEYNRKYDDTWIGGGFSYKISDRFYIGASTFLSTKTLQYEFSRNARAYHLSDSVLVNNSEEAKYIAQSSFEEDLSYWYLSFIVKLGAQYKTINQQFSIGLNITFPDIPIYGVGSVSKSIERSNVFDNSIGQFTANDVLIETEEDIRVRVKNPLSLSLGLQYFTKNRKNSLSLTLEYFSKIDPYAILNSSRSYSKLPSYIDDELGDGDFMSYFYEARSLTNFSFGFKQYIAPKLTFLGGFRTDFTNGDKGNSRYIGDNFSISQIHIDKYHITGGFVSTIWKLKILSGIQYTFARNHNVTQLINYSNPVEYNPKTQQSLEGQRQNNAKIKMNEIALFFGMSVEFN